jgi:hypothetical protein
MNEAIDELVAITGNEKYEKFRPTPFDDLFNFIAFRQSLNALINRLHAEFFSDEPLPFSGAVVHPTTVVTQTQLQEQSTIVSVVLDYQERLISKLEDKTLDENERTFLEKVKENLRGVVNVSQLILLFLNTAKDFGIEIKRLIDLLS